MENPTLEQKMFDFLLDNLAFEVDQNYSLNHEGSNGGNINTTIRLVLLNPHDGEWYTIGSEEIRIPSFNNVGDY